MSSRVSQLQQENQIRLLLVREAKARHQKETISEKL